MTRPPAPHDSRNLTLRLPTEVIDQLKTLQNQWRAASLSEVVRRLAFGAAAATTFEDP